MAQRIKSGGLAQDGKRARGQMESPEQKNGVSKIAERRVAKIRKGHHVALE